MEQDKKAKFRCEECKSTMTYTLVNGTLVCRRCGHRREKERWLQP